MSDERRQNNTLLLDHIKHEEEKFDAINLRLSNLEKQLSDLIELWTQAKGVLNFIKIVAGIGAAIAAIYTFSHDHFTIIPK